MSDLWKSISGFFGKSNKNQSIDEILNLEDETKIIIVLSERISAKIQQLGYQNLSEAERSFYFVYWLEGEVNNGGFNQYFFNSAGDYAQDTVKALEDIGANYTANLLQQAMSIFPEKKPSPDRYKRQEQLENIGEEGDTFLNELDQKFYVYTDPIGALLVGYVKKFKEQF